MQRVRLRCCLIDYPAFLAILEDYVVSKCTPTFRVWMYIPGVVMRKRLNNGMMVSEKTSFSTPCHV